MITKIDGKNRRRIEELIFWIYERQYAQNGCKNEEEITNLELADDESTNRL